MPGRVMKFYFPSLLCQLLWQGGHQQSMQHTAFLVQFKNECLLLRHSKSSNCSFGFSKHQMKFNKYQVDDGKLSTLLSTVRKSKYGNFTSSAVNYIFFHSMVAFVQNQSCLKIQWQIFSDYPSLILLCSINGQKSWSRITD